MNILILGASGFIGSTIARRLSGDGHAVTGLGRNLSLARRRMDEIQWRETDLATVSTAAHWAPLLEGVDAVVNAAGALQDGARDDLAAVQDRAMQALYATAGSSERPPFIVQISARTDGSAADTAFLGTKKSADDALKASGVPHVILRPAVVLSRNAHGGPALLRALAALPFAIPVIHAENPIDTVGLDDVATFVSDAITGKIAPGSDIDLASEERHSLADLVVLHRRWLGLPEAPVVPLPTWLARPVTLGADIAGWLGWRSPFRSTAMRVMQEGVTAKRNAGLSGAKAVLAANPAGAQDLWFARLYLLKPVIILCLSLFWLLSGIVPLFNMTPATVHFAGLLSPPLAIAAVILTCLADIVLGAAVLFRAHAKKAMIGMLALSAAYLGAATLVEPSLWLDPIGPLVKVLPSLALTLVGLSILDER
jgi:uncharacterized protein YbjT (DUF2867 family)